MGRSKAFSEAPVKRQREPTAVSLPKSRLGKGWAGAGARASEESELQFLGSGLWLSVLLPGAVCEAFRVLFAIIVSFSFLLTLTIRLPCQQ